jgi:hypothetical protein
MVNVIRACKIAFALSAVFFVVQVAKIFVVGISLVG